MPKWSLTDNSSYKILWCLDFPFLISIYPYTAQNVSIFTAIIYNYPSWWICWLFHERAKSSPVLDVLRVIGWHSFSSSWTSSVVESLELSFVSCFVVLEKKPPFFVDGSHEQWEVDEKRDVNGADELWLRRKQGRWFGYLWLFGLWPKSTVGRVKNQVRNVILTHLHRHSVPFSVKDMHFNPYISLSRQAERLCCCVCVVVISTTITTAVPWCLSLSGHPPCLQSATKCNIVCSFISTWAFLSPFLRTSVCPCL